MPSITREAASRAAQNQAELAALRQGLEDLRAYLTSDKFADDKSVNTRDVLHRMYEITSAADDAAFSAEEV